MPAPVEPGMMNGPETDDAIGWGVADDSGTGSTGSTEERIGRMLSKMPPLDGLADAEGASGVADAEGSSGVADAEEAAGVGVGWRIGIGPPVVPSKPPRSDERKPPAGALDEGVGVGMDSTAEGVGCSTTALEAGATLDTTEDDAGTMISGSRPPEAEDGLRMGGRTEGGSSSLGR
jgi:hypothetical protein